MKAGLALTLAILLAACGSSEDAADSEAKPVALVALAPARQGAVDETLTVYGAVEAGAMGKHVLAAPAEATVVAIEQDYEDQVLLAVAVDDDPGKDLGHEGKPAHRFFFRPEEVERLPAEMKNDGNAIRSS